jgi:hypothetical protein
MELLPNQSVIVPGVFKGRRQQVALHWMFIAFFVAFLVPTFGFFVVYIANPAGIGIGGGGSLLWLVMLGMCFRNLFAAMSTVQIDENGISIAGPMGKSAARWDEIVRLELGDQSTSTLKLRLRSGKTLPLQLQLIEDGQELGRIVQRRFRDNEAQALPISASYPVANRALLTLASLAVTALMIAGGVWLVHGAHGKDWLRGYLTVPASIVWLFLVWVELSRFVRLTPSELTFGTVLRQRTIPLDRIERMSSHGVAGAAINLWVDHTPLRLPARLERADELLQRLVALVPDIAEEYGQPEDIDRPGIENPFIEPLPENMSFRPRAAFIVSAACMCLLYVPFTAMGPYLLLQDQTRNAIGLCLASVALFGSMLCFSIWLGLSGMARYQLEGKSLVKSGPLGGWNLNLADVDRAWSKGSSFMEFRMAIGSLNFDINLAPLGNGALLRAAILERIPGVQGRPPEPRRYQMEGRGAIRLLFTIGLLMVIGCGYLFVEPGRGGDSTRFLAGTLAGGGVLLCLFMFAVARKAYVTTNEGIWVCNWNGKRFINYADIKRIEADSVATKNGALRRITLEHPEGGVQITSQIEDFNLLERFVRERVKG